jgi:predicted nucleotidyltransferase
METIPADLVRDVVQRLVSEFDPDRIILFGSHAWGKPDDGSDLDLLVIVPESQESPVQRAVRAHRCLREVKVAKDLIVETRDEVARFSRVPASLEAQILKKGIVLYGRGEARTGSQLAV